MEFLERRAEDPEVTVLVVADDLGIAAFEATAIARRKVGFRVDVSRLIDVSVGAETGINHNKFAEFSLGDAVDGVGTEFVLENVLPGTNHSSFAESFSVCPGRCRHRGGSRGRRR